MSDVKAAEVPWSEAVVMICTKCSRKIVGNEDLADQFKKVLKGSFKDAGLNKNIRTVTSSCLDICPKEQVAIAVLRKNGPARAVCVDPNIKETELFTEVRKLALP